MAAAFPSQAYADFYASTQRGSARESPVLAIGTKTMHRTLACLPRDNSAMAFPANAADSSVHDTVPGTLLLEVPEASVDPHACQRSKYPTTHGTLATVPQGEVERLRFSGISGVGLPAVNDGSSRVINAIHSGYQTLWCNGFEVHPSDTLIWVIPRNNNPGGHACVMPERLLLDATSAGTTARGLVDAVDGKITTLGINFAATGTMSPEDLRFLESRRIGFALYGSNDSYVDVNVQRS